MNQNWFEADHFKSSLIHTENFKIKNISKFESKEKNYKNEKFFNYQLRSKTDLTQSSNLK